MSTNLDKEYMQIILGKTTIQNMKVQVNTKVIKVVVEELNYKLRWICEQNIKKLFLRRKAIREKTDELYGKRKWNRIREHQRNMLQKTKTGDRTT